MSVHTITFSEYNAWNDFVDLSPQGDVFCYSWWLDAVTNSNFNIVVVKEKDSIIAGIPLAYDRYGRINQPTLTRTLGILFQPGSPDHIKSSRERKLLSELTLHLPLEEVCQFCTHHDFTDWLPLKWAGLHQTTRYTYLLHYLGKNEKDLRENLNRGRKNMINRAMKNGISVVEGDDPYLLYNCVEKSYKRQGKKVTFTVDFLANLDRRIKENGNRLILNAFGTNGSLYASIYVVYSKRSAYFLLSGSDPDTRHLGGQSLLLWEALKYFRNKVEYFNFGGSDIRNIEEHFRGFGGIMTPYFHIYNEKNLHSTDIRFHLNEIKFHTMCAFRAISLKYIKI